MARCVFENLTIEQAKTLADWFSGQGEQNCADWFDNVNIDAPLAVATKVFGHDIIVQCKSSKGPSSSH